MNGAKLVSHITQANKDVQCIICSMYDDDEFIFSALKNGALGYLLKDSAGKQIITALEGLKNGGSPMSPYIARRVIASFQQRQEKKVSELLSEREHEVLQHLAQGLIYKEIGEKLFISHETVKQHIKHIYQGYSLFASCPQAASMSFPLLLRRRAFTRCLPRYSIKACTFSSSGFSNLANSIGLYSIMFTRSAGTCL